MRGVILAMPPYVRTCVSAHIPRTVVHGVNMTTLPCTMCPMCPPPPPDGIGEPFFRDASSSFLVQVEALLSYDMKGALRDAAASGRQPTMDLAGAVGECRTYSSAHDDSSCCIGQVE